MARLQRISAEAGLLRAIVAGDFSIDEAKKGFVEILDTAGRHRTKKILVDGREVKGEPELIHRFIYSTFAAGEVAKYVVEHRVGSPQFAYVLREPVLDPQRFGETVAVNRGMRIKVFDNLEEALNWLGKAKAVRKIQS